MQSNSPYDFTHVNIVRITAADPLAGFVGVLTLGANWRYMPLLIRCQFATSAAAGDRYPVWSTLLRGSTYQIACSSQAQAASTTLFYTASIGMGASVLSPNAYQIIMMLPSLLILESADTISLSWAGLDGGDQISAISGIFARWPSNL